MNTRIEYLYRDADNHKVMNSEILHGEINHQQINEITDCLEDGELFIPHQVGLSETRFSKVTDSDHCWFELQPEQNFTITDEEATIDMTVTELVKRFQTAKNNWDEKTFSDYASAMLNEKNDDNDNDGQYVIAIEQTDTLPAKVIGVFGEDAMQEQVDSLVKEGYNEDDIHVFFAKDEIK